MLYSLITCEMTFPRPFYIKLKRERERNGDEECEEELVANERAPENPKKQ